MRPTGYFSEGISGGNGNRDRRNHPRFHDTECKQGRAESPNQRLECLREFGSLKVLGSHVVSEQWGGGNDSCDSGGGRQRSPNYRIDAAKMDVVPGQSLVNRCALLKEQHPRSDSCADVRQHDDQSVFAQTARKRLPSE